MRSTINMSHVWKVIYSMSAGGWIGHFLQHNQREREACNVQFHSECRECFYLSKLCDSDHITSIDQANGCIK